MKQFEYEITKHDVEAFQEVTFFCTAQGDCSLHDVPGDQIQILKDHLNQQGQGGWELIQLTFGKEGFLAFWKRRVKDR